MTRTAPTPARLSRALGSDHRPLRFLWTIDLDHRSRMRHGGNLRWFNLSRELLLRGHHVYFAINRHPVADLEGRREYIAELLREEVLSGFVELDNALPRRVS